MFKLNILNNGTNDPFHHLEAREWAQKQIDWAEKSPASGSGLLPVLKHFFGNKPIIGCEIGVCLGYTADLFLKEINFSKYYAIDNYPSYTDWDGSNINADRQNFIKQHAFNKLSKYKNLEFNFISSTNFAEMIPDSSLDFIFVDGDHSYEGVLRDFKQLYNKVKPFGIFSGHDYNLPGVSKALKEFFKDDFFKIIVVSNNAWYIEK